jgi:hypothetical protein
MFQSHSNKIKPQSPKEHKVDTYEVTVLHLITAPNVLAALKYTNSNELSVYIRFLWFVPFRCFQPSLIIESKVRAYH